MRTVTVVVLVALIAVGMDMAWALRSPRGQEKPGACPKVRPGNVGICVERCSGDNSCPKKMKCCSNGCGHVCMQPVFYCFRSLGGRDRDVSFSQEHSTVNYSQHFDEF
uniref:WAP four-disulfide core domain protein 18-like n=1 Tax=Jaculus jaculus TaxID=51337 RepID=UPI001E1B4BCD|nr:WAP four-disulfide core domain protein 18-like [Jaculus jaculus]